ncbi:MAG: phospholipid/cholesterol/gamma-HCH transport system substrate-binding protein [Verrucomicrobiota bacterium]|jgi:ABC-type transporter Mla subunit MlaD
MNRHERGIEFKVGAFVFLGLAMLGALVVQFGRLGEGFKKYYPVTVRFADASGLLKGSDVLLAGAKIGKVAGGPRMVAEGNGVDVPLKIYDYIKIPEGSKISVGSSGLLGDRFVNVVMPPKHPDKYIPANSHINGTREGGIDDITREGSALVSDLRGTVQKIDSAMDRLNKDMLSPETAEHFKASMQHLDETTTALAQSSQKLDGVVGTAGDAMLSIKKDADDLQNTIADARKVFQSATQGKGLLPTLLSDQELATNLRALIANLRAHGVLFYRDSAAKIDMNARPQPKPTPKSGGAR